MLQPSLNSTPSSSLRPVVQMVQLTVQQHATLLTVLKLSLFSITLEEALNEPRFAPVSRDLDLAEVFTTAQSVVLAGRAAGQLAEPFDVKHGHEDACTKAGFLQMLNLVMRIRPGGLLCVAPDCSSFGFGPSVWSGRTANNVRGDTSRKFVKDGNLMACAAMFLYCLAILRGVEAVLENPAGSQLFRFLRSSIQHLAPLGLASFFYVPRCAYDDGESSGPAEPSGSTAAAGDGVPKLKWLKRYKFMCTGSWFRAVVLPCTCTSHRPLMDEVVLPDGTVQRNGRRGEMAQSGLYPPRLGAAIVSAWLGHGAVPVPVPAAPPAGLAGRDVAPPVVQWSRVISHADPWAVDQGDPGRKKPRKPRSMAALTRHADPWGEEIEPAAVSVDLPDPWS